MALKSSESKLPFESGVRLWPCLPTFLAIVEMNKESERCVWLLLVVEGMLKREGWFAGVMQVCHMGMGGRGIPRISTLRHGGNQGKGGAIWLILNLNSMTT